MNKIFSSLLTLVLIVACASQKVPTRVLSEPEWKDTPSLDNEKRVTISSINYFNSSLTPQLENYESLGSIKVGGIQLIEKYTSILKQRLDNKVLLLSTGELVNENQNGGIETLLKDFERIGVDAFHLSEKELKMLPLSKINKTKNKFVNSNIIDLKKQSPLTSNNIGNYMIKRVNGVKVGIMAVTTFKNIEARKHKYLKGLYFEDPVFSILKVHELLKRKGAEIFVLMIKSHKTCPNQKCESTEEELQKLLKRLPPQKIDLIIGSEPKIINEKIGGIPFIQNLGEGKYISRVDLFYNTKEKKVISSKTNIHPPIKLCSQFFKATDDCHIENDLYKEEKINLIKENQVEMSRARFLDIEI